MKYEKLDPEFKAKWVAALRSGKYPQGTRHLLFEGKYCCLGVAGAICNVPLSLLRKHNYFHIDMNLIGVIPVQLMSNEYANSIVKFLSFHNDGEVDSEINPDGEQWDFNQIADWIEANL